MVSTDDARQNTARALSAMVRAAQQLRFAWAAQLGIAVTDTFALDGLLDGPLTPGQLSRLLEISTGSVTGLVDRLEQAGLARREPHPSDRRAVHVVLTDHGRRSAAAAKAGMADLLDAIGADRMALAGEIFRISAEVLGAYANRLEAEARAADVSTRRRNGVD